ncbi:MAG: FHA domain-containing protein, partial [Cyanobacteria bacterium P01_A01_bin.83]
MSAKVTLTVTEGKLKGEQFSFDSRDTCIVGRHPDCKIQIPNDKYHATISRYHCLLDINPPAIRVRDFGSRHGTYVNGKCIGKRGKDQSASQGTKLELSQYDLSNGDVIKLSNTAFQVNIEQGLESTWIPKQTDEILSRQEFNVNSNLGSIDRYTKIKLLGEGTFGAVYLARLDDVTGR